jgi:pimeloyl-ACP methyl ester carboxylesterase
VISPDPIVSLPPALAGTRRELDSVQTGRVAWYQDAPTGSAAPATPLLLVHSVNAVATAYEVRPLYEHYRHLRPVYAIDLPGFGQSARPRRLYSPRLMTDAILALVNEIRRERGPVPIDALALSLSTEFLARAAGEFPAAFRSLALVSPTGFNRAALRLGPAGSTLGRPGALTLLTQTSLGAKIFRQLTRRFVIAYFLRRTWGSRRIDAGLLDYSHASARIAGAEHAPLHFLTGYLFGGDSGGLYRALEQPVWAVHGVRGDFTNYRSLPMLVAARHNWTVQVLPTGALPYFEMPEEFFRRYDAWSATPALHCA